jgi:hypothetical protein
MLLCLLALLPCLAQSMVFTPSPDTSGHMRSNWDNWGQIHNGTWYLYYIVGGECSGRWVAYGVATSVDGVHWSDKGDMMYPMTEVGADQSCANKGYSLGSGWVWQSPATKKWLVNWSQSNKKVGPGQSIFFATADSPEGPWENISTHSAASAPASRPDPRWYTSTSGMGRWDTIRPVLKDANKPSEGWWGFVTATPLASPNTSKTAVRPGFALVESSNGYTWTSLPPPAINFKIQPANPNVEASGAQRMTGPDGRTRWYALVGAAAWTSIGGRMGMFYYVADDVTGPYEQRGNYALMAYEQGWITPAYFCSFYPTEGTVCSVSTVLPLLTAASTPPQSTGCW